MAGMFGGGGFQGMAGAPQALQLAYSRDPKLRLAQQLIAQGADTSPVQSPWQGVGRVAQALIGGYQSNRVNEDYEKQAQQYQDDMRSLYAPVQELQAGASGAGPRPDAQMTTRAPTLQEMLTRGQNVQSPFVQDQLRQLQLMGVQQQAEDTRFQRGQQAEGARFERDLAARREDAEAARRFQADQARLNDKYEIKEVGGRVVAINPRDPRQRMDLGPANSGAFAGSGMDPQAWNLLLNPNSDPASPQYAAAYAHLTQPKLQMVPGTDGQLVMSQVTPTLPPNIRPPVFAQPGAQPAPASGAPAPQAAPPSSGAVPPATQLPGMTVTPIAPARALNPQEKQKLDQSVANAAQISLALDDFSNSFRNAGFGERARSALGFNTGLNTAFNGAALLAKGEELFNLGVLNGPDLDIIRRTLPDPSTMRGAGTSPEQAERAANAVRQMLQDRLSAFMRQKGMEPIDIAAYGRQLRGQQQTISPPQPPQIDPQINSLLDRYAPR